MIDLEEGLVLSGRVTCGYHAGYITEITSKTYRVRWLDGDESEQLRPDFDDQEALQAAE